MTSTLRRGGLGACVGEVKRPLAAVRLHSRLEIAAKGGEEAGGEDPDEDHYDHGEPQSHPGLVAPVAPDHRFLKATAVRRTRSTGSPPAAVSAGTSSSMRTR